MKSDIDPFSSLAKRPKRIKLNPAQRRFERVADSFVYECSPNAAVLMPGCHGVFLNETAQLVFGDDLPVADSPRSALRFLKRQNLERLKAAYSTSECLCYHRAIIALCPRHCVLEHNYDMMIRNGKRQVRDIAAILESQQGQRNYQLYLTEIRQISVHLIEVRMVKMAGVSVSVNTLRSHQNGAAFILEAEVLETKRDFGVRKIKKRIRAAKSHYKVYDAFTNAITRLNVALLSSAKKQRKALADARQEALSEIKGIPKPEYEAVLGFVNGIFGTSVGYSLDRKPLPAVVSELKSIQDRLFDAFIVVDSIAPKIRKKIIDARILRL